MAKASGRTRTSSASNPNGIYSLSASRTQTQQANGTEERLAENFGRAAGIDADDILYSTVSDSPASMIERAIEANTDYDVVGVRGNEITIINRNGDPSEYNYDDPTHTYYAGRKTVYEVIRELRERNERRLFSEDFR